MKVKDNKVGYCIIGCLAVPIICLAIYQFVWSYFGKPTYLPIEEYIGTTLPKEATDVHFGSYSGFQGNRWRLRFDLLATELADFIDAFCPQLILADNKLPLRDEKKFDWWNPESSNNYSRGDCIVNNAAIYQVQVDKTNPESYIIFIAG